MFHVLKLVAAFSFICVGFHTVAKSDDQDIFVSVYTEEYPPFNFRDPETGVITGDSTKKVIEVLERAGIRYEIKILPWQRAVRAVKADKNALIYTIVRIPEREDQYRWLLPIAPADFYIYMKASDKRTLTYDALKTGEYTASCVAQDITCDLFRIMGMPNDHIMAVPKDTTGDFRLVMAGRTDLFISDRSTYQHLREIEGFDMSLLRRALPVNVKSGFYLAANMDFPEEIASKIIDAKMALEADCGTVQCRE